MASIKEYIHVLLKDRSLMENAFQAMREKQFKKRMKAELGQAALPTVDLNEVVKESDLKIDNYTYLSGNSLPTDMALVKSLAENMEDCVFLEIGSWRGETMSNVAPVCRKAMSLTLGKEDMKRFGMSDEFARSHAIFTKDVPNLEVYYHDSQTFDFASLSEQPNLIFVDGDHSYKAVKKDTENAFKCLKKGGAIVWHDYAYSPEDVRFDVMAAIYDGTPKEVRNQLYHVSNSMCAIYLGKAMQGEYPRKPAFPKLAFDMNIRVRGI
jgi:hypothetical protein